MIFLIARVVNMWKYEGSGYKKNEEERERTRDKAMKKMTKRVYICYTDLLNAEGRNVELIVMERLLRAL